MREGVNVIELQGYKIALPGATDVPLARLVGTAREDREGAGVVGDEAGVVPSPRSLDRPVGRQGSEDLAITQQHEGEGGEDDFVHEFSTEPYPGSQGPRHNAATGAVLRHHTLKCHMRLR